MPFEFTRQEIPDLVCILPKAFSDNRGFFMETYKYSEFYNFGIKDQFNQDNHSRSTKSVLRGLHYQKEPKGQSKIVRCTQGKIFDVAVDIRKGSPTYSKWFGIILSEENRLMLYVPSGFAHGFLVLSENAEVIYKTSGEYSSEHDAGIFWNDPKIGIKWLVKEPVVSGKDRNLPLLDLADNNFFYNS